MKNGKVLAKLMQNAKVERIEILELTGRAVVVLKPDFHVDGKRTLTAKTAHEINGFVRAAKTKAQNPNKTVTNLMTGKPISIPVDTPRACDPSTELYWSM